MNYQPKARELPRGRVCKEAGVQVSADWLTGAGAVPYDMSRSVFSTLRFHGIRSGGLLPELLGEADENSFGASDVTESVDTFVIDDFIDYCRTELAEPGEGIVEVFNGEHYTHVSQ